MPSKKRSDQVTPVADEKAAVPVPSTDEPPDPWKAFLRWVWKRFGLPGLVIVLACGVVWSQWDSISKLPGVESLVARIKEKSLPKAEAGKFNIAIAHLATTIPWSK
jgi:hypothetical protein